MKKVLSYILIVIGLGILFISTSREVMGWISNYRNDLELGDPIGPHNFQKGDLVNMAFLDDVEKFHSDMDYHFKKAECSGEKNINLYALGDSYIHMAPDSAFGCAAQYKYAWRYWQSFTYTIEEDRKNILIIEVSERYIRTYFNTKDVLWQLQKQLPQAFTYNNTHKTYAAFPIPDSLGDLFNPYINQNIEFNLFNYNFFNPIRRFKGKYTYRLFGRASGNVAVAKNDDQLLLKETILPYKRESSYVSIPDIEIDTMVAHLNEFYEHYTKDGFQNVYISLIPNATTIVQPEGYNELIPRIQNHPSLKVGVIDIYSLYKEQSRSMYRKGDTHWNDFGHQLWIQAVNKMLEKESLK